MILTRYEFELKATCPVDGSEDTYAVTVEAHRIIPVERILEVARRATADHAYQETITEHLAEVLCATVTTVGDHSGVKTTSRASW